MANRFSRIGVAAADLARLHRLAGWLLTVAVSVVTTWWLAGLFWRMTGPDPVFAPRQAIEEPALLVKQIARAQLFGKTASADQNPSAALNGIRVTGILASTPPGRGQALLGREKEKPRWIREGDEFETGVRVARIGPRQVELRTAVSAQTFPLPEKASR